jgi:hypothetical protein
VTCSIGLLVLCEGKLLTCHPLPHCQPRWWPCIWRLAACAVAWSAYVLLLLASCRLAGLCSIRFTCWFVFCTVAEDLFDGLGVAGNAPTFLSCPGAVPAC